MIEPIRVTIKDLIGNARAITWLNKGAKWLPANGEITVNYEPWSCADSTQRSAIVAALAWGRVSMTLHIVKLDGSVIDVPYNPACATGMPRRTEVSEVKPPVNLAVKNICSADSDHTIVTGTDKAATAFGFTAERVVAPTRDKDTNSLGFNKAAFAASDEHVVIAGSDKAIKEIVDNPSNDVEESADESVQPVDEPSEDDMIRAAFNALCAEKRWTEALELLVKTFGQEKITFTARAISASKDYDALCKKYNLK